MNLKEEIGQLKGDKNSYQNVKANFQEFMKIFKVTRNTISCLLNEKFRPGLIQML
jgi:hypothetical protein